MDERLWAMWEWISWTFCPGWPWTMIFYLPSS
jgi:hypothetical protein